MRRKGSPKAVRRSPAPKSAYANLNLQGEGQKGWSGTGAEDEKGGIPYLPRGR
jgi:hypothetical protein